MQNYDTTESKLRREFEVYGPIKRVGQPAHLLTFASATAYIFLPLYTGLFIEL